MLEPSLVYEKIKKYQSRLKLKQDAFRQNTELQSLNVAGPRGSKKSQQLEKMRHWLIKDDGELTSDQKLLYQLKKCKTLS